MSTGRGAILFGEGTFAVKLRVFDCFSGDRKFSTDDTELSPLFAVFVVWGVSDSERQ